jgi:hypothetical protein
VKCTPSAARTPRKAVSLSVRLDVVVQVVAQHTSRTLKFVSPFCTKHRMSSFLCVMNPESKFSEKSFSPALVQWPLSLQQREKRYLGSGGTMTHGFSPLAFKIGSTSSITFLKIPSGVVVTLPPQMESSVNFKWKGSGPIKLLKTNGTVTQ